MIRFNQFKQLNEVLDNPYKWKWHIKTRENYEGRFKTDNNVLYEVNIVFQFGVWDTEWGNLNKNFDIENTFKIVSTVADIYLTFLKIEKPKTLVIPHESKSRFKLFDRIFKRKTDNYVITKPSGNAMMLTRKQTND